MVKEVAAMQKFSWNGTTTADVSSMINTGLKNVAAGKSMDVKRGMDKAVEVLKILKVKQKL